MLGKLFKRKEEPEVTPMDKMEQAVDDMNEAWDELKARGNRARPWIIWEEQRVVISRWNGQPEIIYETEE